MYGVSGRTHKGQMKTLIFVGSDGLQHGLTMRHSAAFYALTKPNQTWAGFRTVCGLSYSLDHLKLGKQKGLRVTCLTCIVVLQTP